jgi:hypothetical protein
MMATATAKMARPITTMAATGSMGDLLSLHRINTVASSVERIIARLTGFWATDL